MTLELWTAMSDTLDFLERDPTVSGAVFASELKKPIFTAGNDIKELHAKSTTKARYAKFWRVQTSFLCRAAPPPPPRAPSAARVPRAGARWLCVAITECSLWRARSG